MHTSCHHPPLLPNTVATDCAYALSMQRLEKRRPWTQATGLALLWKESYVLGVAATGLGSACHKNLVLSAARLHLPCICLALRGRLAVEVFSRQGPLLAWPHVNLLSVVPLCFVVIRTLVWCPWLWTLQGILLLSPTLVPSLPLSDFHSSLSAPPWPCPTLDLPGTGPPV